MNNYLNHNLYKMNETKICPESSVFAGSGRVISWLTFGIFVVIYVYMYMVI